MKKVITYGTFDLFHQGHYNILKRAKEAGDYLIVGVTGESYDLERGKINVRDSLLTRIENVRKTGFADQIIIEEYQGQKVDDILKYKVDLFIVGSDWIGKFDYLNNYCEVKYLERTKDISSTQLRSQGYLYKIGILTEDTDDCGVVYESKFVSGVHIDAVYCENIEVSKKFADKYEIDKYFNDYNDFLEDIDIVYIKASVDRRYKLVKEALIHGKYVIVDSPVSLERKKMEELFDLAHQNRVLIIENIISAYLRAFNQLVWLLNSNLIGNIIGIDASMSEEGFETYKSIEEMLVYPIIFISKLLNGTPTKISTDKINDLRGKIYFRTQLCYDKSIVNIAVGDNINIKNSFLIYGTNGSVRISDDWWNTGYFEAWIDGEKNKKRYSFNFEGDGFRYLLQELLIMIREKRSECTRIFDKDSLKLIDLIGGIMK